MINEIKVFSRDDMNNFAAGNQKMPYKSWFLISIYGSRDMQFLNVSNFYVLMQQGMKDCMSLQFDDLTYKEAEKLRTDFPDADRVKKMILFNNQHAKAIINFLHKIEVVEGESALVVHCKAGISRSGAVGIFANDYYKLGYFDFKGNNPQIQPNYDVLGILKKEAGMTYDT